VLDMGGISCGVHSRDLLGFGDPATPSPAVDAMMPHVAGPFLDETDARFDVERLVFFSDAVIAIAITLLVIQLVVPADLQTDAQLRDALIALAPGFSSFVLTFAVIGIWWAGHHRLTRALARVSGATLVLNLVLLGGIAFLPFASGVLGHHGNLPTAVMLYAATNVLIAATLVGMRVVAVRQDLLRDGANDAAFRRRTWFTLGTAAIFAISIPVAAASPILATQSWDLVLLLVLIRGWSERRPRQPVAQAGSQGGPPGA
jgi:TMEM175 potassium channel family protein